jgi:hypothetical protein
MTALRRQMGWRGMAIHAGIPLLLVSALSLQQLDPLLSGALHNPDSYMRLARLHDSLLTGMQVHSMTRDGSGVGTVIHWSHLIDSVLCLIALPLRTFFDERTALHLAAIVFGPLNMAALGMAVAWASLPFSDRRWLWLGSVAACLGPAILLYGLAGVVHHHVGCVVVAVMCGGWAARALTERAPRHAGWPLGAWAGLGLWLTPETLPLSVMAFAALWLGWVLRPQAFALSRIICDAGQGLLIVTWLAWLVDPPFGGHTSEDLDRVSIVFVVLTAAIAATTLVMRTLEAFSQRPIHRLLVSLATGSLFAAIWAGLFQQTLFGGHVVTDSAATSTLFRDIAEMAPVTTLSGWLNYLFTGCLATLLLAILGWRLRQPILMLMVVFGLGLVLLGQMHVRFASYPEALGAVMLPIAVSLWGQRVAAWPAWRQPLPRMATIILFVLVPFAGDLARPLKSARADGTDGSPGCAASNLGGMLAPYAGSVMLTDVNVSPVLHYQSGVVTVGSLFHRNPTGFMRLRDAWRSVVTDTVPDAFAIADIEFVLYCRPSGRSPLVRDLSEITVADHLARGDVPSWLRQVAADPASGHVLYQVGPRD